MIEVRPFQISSSQKYPSDGYVELLQNLHSSGRSCKILLQCDKSQTYPDKLSVRYFIDIDDHDKRQVVNSLSKMPVQILTGSPRPRHYGYFAELKLRRPYPLPLIDHSSKGENNSINPFSSAAGNIAESLYGVPSMLEIVFKADTHAAARIWSYLEKFEKKLPSSDILSQLASIGTGFASEAARFGSTKKGASMGPAKQDKELSLFEKNLLDAMKTKARSHAFFLTKITVFGESSGHVENIAKQFPNWHNGFSARVKKVDQKEGPLPGAAPPALSRSRASLLFSFHEYRLAVLSMEEILSMISVHPSPQQSAHFEQGVSRPGADSSMPSK
ncbi:hypothetical protein Ngar_c19630 [Candidatus Nitrososphaera gargensis Ga9.2]|uniref:Uncharacterized protein n=1 Tax=Nitrososphaera gargensis (strain Ga9.2) TaxID=1237085 RepID=K0IGG5_NITGG|nr:hypothetical protein [Candidatus Nitrososphaera gargensis]AFU58895.1 hypothetical protein Ngar_c19630 [Candidatus Nitrososphaera gargensis Ga9.2]